MRDAHQDQSTIHPEVPSKKRVAHQDQADVYSGLQTKASLEYQDKTAILSVWTKVKFEEVFPDETETLEIVQVPVNPIPNNMSNESKLLPDLGHNIGVSRLPMCVKFLENVQEDADYEVDSDDEFDEEVHEKSLKKDEEVYDV